MGFASHLGPWRLGTVLNTTGSTAGSVRNMGCTTVTQTVPLVASTAVTLMIPAGSIVHDIQTYITTGAVGTPDVTIGGTVVGTLSTAAGINELSANTTNIATLINVGTTDKVLSYTATAASAGTLQILYTVRADDGSDKPTAQQA
jgi:hypothetical protein